MKEKMIQDIKELIDAGYIDRAKVLLDNMMKVSDDWRLNDIVKKNQLEHLLSIGQLDLFKTFYHAVESITGISSPVLQINAHTMLLYLNYELKGFSIKVLISRDCKYDWSIGTLEYPTDFEIVYKATEQTDQGLDRFRHYLRHVMTGRISHSYMGDLSAVEQERRKPLKPYELIEAEHDRVHEEVGNAKGAKTVRNSGDST